MKFINDANKSNSKAYSNYTFLLGRPRKGEYSGLPNAKKCKLRQEKLKAKSNEFLNKEKERLAKASNKVQTLNQFAAKSWKTSQGLKRGREYLAN